MAAKKPARKLGKKDLKKTKGGILIGLNQPSLKIQPVLKFEPGHKITGGGLNAIPPTPCI